jgi:hypothetical protein
MSSPMPRRAGDEGASRCSLQETVGSGSGSTAEEIAKLADLRDKGEIGEAKFQQAKAKALS